MRRKDFGLTKRGRFGKDRIEKNELEETIRWDGARLLIVGEESVLICEEREARECSDRARRFEGAKNCFSRESVDPQMTHLIHQRSRRENQI